VTSLQKIRTVATFEFLGTVRRAGYLIATFGMPLFVAGYAGLIAIPAYYTAQQDREPAVHGVVDQAGVLRLSGDVGAESGPLVPEEMRRTLEAAGQADALGSAMTSSRFVFRPFGTVDDARQALTGRTIKGFFVLPPHYLTDGGVAAYGPDSLQVGGADPRNALRDLLRERLVSERLDAVTSERILHPISHTERFAVTASGEIREDGGAASAVRVAVPLAFMVLFLLSILMTSGYLMQGTAVEKENKVVEVLLASANPDEILAGKLLGLGGAGLLQIGVWLTMVLVTGLGIVPLLLSARMDVPWLAIGVAIPFFIVAFLFFGSLILGTGSLGSNMREAQQLAMVWSLLAAMPLMMLMVLVREPSGTVARVLTWIPFTAGPVVVLRASTDAALLPWWEIGGAFFVLLVATWGALRLGGRSFRVGLLSAGARPSLREIIRQARLAN